MNAGQLTAILTLGLVIAACGGSSSPDPTPTESGPAIQTATLSGSPTATSTPTPAPTPTSTPSPLTSIPGVHTSPVERPADGLQPLDGPRDSPFPPHDLESIVLYDTEDGSVRDFGAGSLPVFTADGRYMAWNKPDERLWYVELPAGDPEELGVGGSLRQMQGSVVAVHSGGGVAATLWDLETRTPMPASLPAIPPPTQTQNSYILDGFESTSELVFGISDPPGERRTFSGANSVGFAALGELVFATAADGGISNLFAMDIETGDVTFIATTRAILDAIRFVANERWVAWTDDYCGEFVPGSEQGSTRILDRDSGAIYDLGEALWPTGFTPDGRLGVGSIFGATALIDLEAWVYETVLPEGTVDVSWSPDYRYAARGAAFGHGGVCSF